MYAKRTSVAVTSSRSQIESMIHKAGAASFASGFDNVTGRAVIEFKLKNRRVRFEMNIPSTANEQARRSAWRSLYLVIKAKLESVASRIETFDEAFMAHVVMPDGRRFGEIALKQIEQTTVH